MALLGSVLLLVLVGSSVSGTPGLRITAESGDYIILRCEDPNIDEIFLLEWRKLNLQGEEIVFLYGNDGILTHQDESFLNRVALLDSQMKNGDLSVVLKNVKIEDSGIYQCGVVQRNGPKIQLTLISTIHLQVSPPPGEGDEGGEEDGIGDKDSLFILICLVLLLLVFLLFFLIFLFFLFLFLLLIMLDFYRVRPKDAIKSFRGSS